MNLVDGRLYFAHLAGLFAERVVAALLGLQTRYMGGGWYRATRRTLLVVALIACTVSYSQLPPPAPVPAPSPSATPGAFPLTPEQLTAKLSSTVETELNRLKANAQLKGFGEAVTAFFLVLLLTWSALKNMAGGKGVGELIGDWVPILVSFGVVFLFLDKTAGEIIERTMNVIGSSISGGSVSTLDSALRAGMLPVFKAIAAVVDMPRVTATSADPSGSIFSSATWISWMASLGSIIMAAIGKVVAAFLLVLAGVVMAAHIIMGFVSVTLVLALAPVMVPFLMFKPLSWLFDSWLKFLLGACMLKIVALFLLNIAAGLVASVSQLAAFAAAEARVATAAESFFVDLLLYGILVAFATLAALLMSQAPGIASGLMSGGTGSIGFGGLKGVSHSSAAKIPSMGGAVATQAGRAAQAPFSAARGAAQAFTGKGPDQGRRGGVAGSAYRAGRGAGSAGRWVAKKAGGGGGKQP